MVNSKKLIAGLGVVAGLGVAMLPLTSYATEASEASGSAGLNQVVRAQVAQVFTIKVESNKTITAANSEALAISSSTNPNTELQHTITVTGNVYGGYELKLGAVDTTDLRFVRDSSKDFWVSDRYDSSVKIPTGTSIDGSTSAWGYKATNTATSGTPDYTGKSWTALSTTPAKIGENTANSFDDKTYVNYGISASESQAAGVYEGKVVYSAVSKI